MTGGCLVNPMRYCPATTVTRDQHGCSSSVAPTLAAPIRRPLPRGPCSRTFQRITGPQPGSSNSPTKASPRAAAAATSARGQRDPRPDGDLPVAQRAWQRLHAARRQRHHVRKRTVQSLGRSVDEQLANEGITGGCGSRNCCSMSSSPVTRWPSSSSRPLDYRKPPLVAQK